MNKKRMKNIENKNCYLIKTITGNFYTTDFLNKSETNRFIFELKNEQFLEIINSEKRIVILNKNQIEYIKGLIVCEQEIVKWNLNKEELDFLIGLGFFKVESNLGELK